MNLRQLRVLVAVAEAGGVNRAAAALGVAQPGVTRAIRELEAETGTALFNRGPRGMTATPAGATLIAHARAVEAELRRAKEEVASLRDAGAGQVLIGATPVVVAEWLPRSLERLMAETPRLRVSVVEDVYLRRLLPALAAGELDLVLGPLPEGGVGAGLTEEPVFYDRLDVIARAGHPLARRRKLAFANLAGAEWILPPPDVGPRRHLENAFRAAGVAPPATGIESASMPCVKALLMGSDRLTALPPPIYRPEETLGLIVRLRVEWNAPWRPVGIMRRARGTLSPAATALVAHLRTAADEAGWRTAAK